MSTPTAPTPTVEMPYGTFLEPSPPQRRCETCRFSRPRDDRDDYLTCHRHAPEVRSCQEELPRVAVWPMVYHDEWCGEYGERF